MIETVLIAPRRCKAGVIFVALDFDRKGNVGVGEIHTGNESAAIADYELLRWGREASSPKDSNHIGLKRAFWRDVTSCPIRYQRPKHRSSIPSSTANLVKPPFQPGNRCEAATQRVIESYLNGARIADSS
ncbi:MAG: hypothetical protein ABR505_07805 [Actinomycetota bacterium]